MLPHLLLLLTLAADPQFSADGQLARPANYREWIFLSSGLGMTYGPVAEGHRDPMFDNVFVHPDAYKAFAATGKWPDKTMFVLEIRGAGSHASINNDGHFQQQLVAVEAAVKDEKRFAEKWAYFDFGTAKPAATAFPKGRCFTCHNTNGAVENTFVQFYPTLLEIARGKGTLKESFRGPASSAPSR